MSDLVTSSFCEDDPAGLVRSLRVMAASIPANGTVTVALTPHAARIAARSIEAGITLTKAMEDARREVVVAKRAEALSILVLAVVLAIACAALVVLT
jgi:hypothetical protein